MDDSHPERNVRRMRRRTTGNLVYYISAATVCQTCIIGVGIFRNQNYFSVTQVTPSYPSNSLLLKLTPVITMASLDSLYVKCLQVSFLKISATYCLPSFVPRLRFPKACSRKTVCVTVKDNRFLFSPTTCPFVFFVLFGVTLAGTVWLSFAAVSTICWAGV